MEHGCEKSGLSQSGNLSLSRTKRKVAALKNIKRQIHKFALTNEELGFATEIFLRYMVCFSQNLV